MALQLKSTSIVVAVMALAWSLMGWSDCVAQGSLPAAMATSASGKDLRVPGSIHGTIVDQSGAVVSGARVALSPGNQSPQQETQSGGDGQFAFANVLPGAFELSITSGGFARQTFSG